MRATVRALSLSGWGHKRIAAEVGINHQTLRKHFHAELDATPVRVRRKPQTLKGTTVTVTCRQCSASFAYEKGGGRLRRFCSDACRATGLQRSVSKTVMCARPGCDVVFAPRHVGRNPLGNSGAFCSHACFAKHQGEAARIYDDPKEAGRQSRHRRRAQIKRTRFERFTREEIFERDGWRCQLCGRKVDRRLAFPHLMSASLDHIVPVSKGGHHIRANVQCSHWICNSRKTAHGKGDQLLLIG